MTRKLTAFILAFTMICTMFTGCSNDNDTSKENGKISIVCTTFPQYDWVLNILGEHADKFNVTLLLSSGVDIHSYQPSTDDILKITNSSLFIYNGGESDKWVEEIISKLTDEKLVTINMLQAIGNSAREEELIEGMEAGDEEHADEGKNSGSEEIEYDEHVWLSLQNAIHLCDYIATSICGIDKENSNDYMSNCKAYIQKLDNLNKQYTEMVLASERKTILFGDRFPFRYLADDYGLTYYAAFIGCSAETEASFKTILFLANKVDELNLPSVLVIETSDKSLAKAIISNTKAKNQDTLVLDSMQNITLNDIDNGTSYLSIMENNFDVLKKALN